MGINGAAYIAAIAAAGGAAASVDASRKASHTKDDADEAKRVADLTAATNANARIKMQRQAMADNSLLTGGGSNPAGRTNLGV